MLKAGVIQTGNYDSNLKGISEVAQILRALGKKEADLICLPEQWLKNNTISNFDVEFAEFKKIAKDFAMTVIPGAFYTNSKKASRIIAPVIDPNGDIIGQQEKIHPFDYEQKTVIPGKEAKIFKTGCKFGVIVCYDMVFPKVANTMAKKGAEILVSPSRIVKRGIRPWHMYVQVRSLENRIPIIAANVENHRFGGQSIIIDLKENNKIVDTSTSVLRGQKGILHKFDLKKFQISRMKRFSDTNSFV